jgi:hypothetical protein
MRLLPFFLEISVSSPLPRLLSQDGRDRAQNEREKITKYVCDGTINPDCDEPELTDLSLEAAPRGGKKKDNG